MTMTMQGDELKAMRKAAGMTQAQMADAIGMTATSIGLMERGDTPIEKRTELAVKYVIYTGTVIGENVERDITKGALIEVKDKPEAD